MGVGMVLNGKACQHIVIVITAILTWTFTVNFRTSSNCLTLNCVILRCVLLRKSVVKG